MPRKIFISYRRQDAGANALGIAQYLERVFGPKNVFIDVDMRAGVKFPTVLEQRLAECKVMLVLIGPEWLNSQDEQKNPRIENPDDWVRLEIAHALKRDITVIPVRVNGAELPSRAVLPDDIRGLLDHQAVSITLPGFRHEMASLVRDIRAIPDQRPWRRLAAIAATSLLVLSAVAGILAFKFTNRAGLPIPEATTVSEQNDFWKSSAGEWVMFAYDRNPVAYYFKPSSVESFGQRVAYTARYPIFKSPDAAVSQSTFSQPSFEDDTTLIECKESMQVLAERTVYNKSGDVISHFKRGDPQSLDFSTGSQIQPSSILSLAQHVFCDEELRTPLSQQVANTTFSYLSPNANGNGDVFYGPTKKISDSGFQFEVLIDMRLFQNQPVKDFYGVPNIIGLPRSYRSVANFAEINCTDRKVVIPKLEYFDEYRNWIGLTAELAPRQLDVKEGTPFGSLFDLVCGIPIPTVAGTYEGTNNLTYKGASGEQRISFAVEQNGSDVKVGYHTADGAQGNGAGKLVGARVDSISLQSTTPTCPGSYDASLTFTDETVSWSFKGQDCGGPIEGHGTAKKVKA